MSSEKNRKRKIQLAKEAAAKAGQPEAPKLNPAEQRASQQTIRNQAAATQDALERAAKEARSQEILENAAIASAENHGPAPETSDEQPAAAVEETTTDAPAAPAAPDAAAPAVETKKQRKAREAAEGAAQAAASPSEAPADAGSEEKDS